MPPLIGLNMSIESLAVSGGERLFVPSGYVDAVAGAGGIPLCVPPSGDSATIRAIVSRLRGFLFIGGADYRPAHYGGHPQPAEELVHPRRDRFDVALAKIVLEETDLPVLGICGGCQLLAIVRGGALIQDIKTEWRPPGGHPPLPHGARDRERGARDRERGTGGLGWGGPADFPGPIPAAAPAGEAKTGEALRPGPDVGGERDRATGPAAGMMRRTGIAGNGKTGGAGGIGPATTSGGNRPEATGGILPEAIDGGTGPADAERPYLHAVRFMPASLAARATGAPTGGTLAVNSFHHQAVHPDRIGRDLVASAWTSDGVVEAIEPAPGSSWAGKGRFVLGVQWHPERMREEAPRRLFFALVEAALRRKG
ncbi:MAG: gamma-glutamyl-gamma-aminobutyrate hydrolase family protein [Pseudomonadota bacterium]|nr:gamma-glutamyl-gamma-aminobutyrate hydrolase family protein [Pseudomonadota bacterium]